MARYMTVIRINGTGKARVVAQYRRLTKMFVYGRKKYKTKRKNRKAYNDGDKP